LAGCPGGGEFGVAERGAGAGEGAVEEGPLGQREGVAKGIAQTVRRTEESGRALRRPVEHRQGGGAGEPIGQHLARPELPPQGQARREPGGGGVVAPVAGHEPEVVEGDCGVERVAEFAVHRQRILEDRRCRRRVALAPNRGAEDVTPQPGGPPTVAQRLEDRLRLPDVGHRVVVVPLPQVDEAEHVQRQGGTLAVAQAAPERQGFGSQRARFLVVAPVGRQQARRAQPPRPHCGGDGRTPRRVERALEPAAPLLPMAAKDPELPQRPGQPQQSPGVAGPLQPGEGRPQVVEIGLDPVRPLQERQRDEALPEAFRQPHAPGRVRASDRLIVAAGGELLQPEFADRFQHAEPRLAVGLLGLRHQAPVNERPEPLQDVDPRIAGRCDHRRGGLQGPAADEDGEAAEEHLLFRG
jgi:hypothetical protein